MFVGPLAAESMNDLSVSKLAEARNTIVVYKSGGLKPGDVFALGQLSKDHRAHILRLVDRQPEWPSSKKRIYKLLTAFADISHRNGHDHAFINLANIELRLGLSRSTVKRHVHGLEKESWIGYSPGPGRSRSKVQIVWRDEFAFPGHRTCLPRTKMTRSTGSKCPGGYKEEKQELNQTTSSSSVAAEEVQKVVDQFGGLAYDDAKSIVQVSQAVWSDVPQETLLNTVYEVAAEGRHRRLQPYLKAVVPQRLEVKRRRHEQQKQHSGVNHQPYNSERQDLAFQRWRTEQEHALTDPSVSEKEKQLIRQVLNDTLAITQLGNGQGVRESREGEMYQEYQAMQPRPSKCQQLPFLTQQSSSVSNKTDLVLSLPTVPAVMSQAAREGGTAKAHLPDQRYVPCLAVSLSIACTRLAIARAKDAGQHIEGR